MLRIRSILHPTDFSACAAAAYVRALDVAHRHGATVYVAHMAPSLREHHLRDIFRLMVDEDVFYRRQQAEAEAQMAQLQATHPAGDVPVETVALSGLSPAKAVLTYAATQDVDLIVMGTHGLRGVRHLLLGSVAEEVLRGASCPVLTVRAPAEAEAPATAPAITRVLVPVDFSSFAESSVRYGQALAQTYDAGLDLLHVVDPVQQPVFYEAGLRARDRLERDLEAEALTHLRAMYDALGGPALEVTFLARTGYPPAEIVAAAEERAAGLLVLSTHGLRGLERIPLGSVAERVVRQAPCPVLVSKPFGTSLLDPAEVAEAASG